MDLEDYYEVNDNGCWIWQRAVTGSGYGYMWVDGNQTSAHRFFYQEFKREIPEGMEIDHLCRNKICVNPDHLEAVSSAKNTQRGEPAKLTKEDVKEIRKKYSQGDITQRGLAEKYGVSRAHISNVVNKGSWRNVEDVENERGEEVRRKRFAEVGRENADKKLTFEDAEKIRERYEKEDISQSDLAEDFGVSQSAIWKIVNEKAWA